MTVGEEMEMSGWSGNRFQMDKANQPCSWLGYGDKGEVGIQDDFIFGLN